MLKKIFYLGVKADMSDSMVKKIILSNQLLILLFIFNIMGSSIEWIFLPQLFFLGLISFILIFVAYFFNYAGYSIIARFMVALSPFLIIEITTAAIAQTPKDLFIGNEFLAFSLMVMPFIVFDLREKLNLWLSFCCCFLIFNISPQLNQWIDIPLNNTDFRQTQPLIAMIAVGSLVSSLYALQNLGIRAENKNAQLINEMSEKAEIVSQAGKKLEQSLEEVQQARLEDERRNRIAIGIAEITAMMRQETEHEMIFDKLISAIVKYVKANQGALHVVEGNSEEEKYILLKSLYAYDKKKFVEQRTEIGQGLLGQCYLEKEKIILKKVPNQYIQITSGLGEITASFVVIQPMLINESVEGFLEIAAFKPLEDFEIGFLEKLSENIASFIKNNRTNFRTKILLEESRQQAELMKAQEDDMRQNVEEMQAFQEDMQRSTQEYINRIQELEGQLK
jgi:hypothetical protein